MYVCNNKPVCLVPDCKHKKPHDCGIGGGHFCNEMKQKAICVPVKEYNYLLQQIANWALSHKI